MKLKQTEMLNKQDEINLYQRINKILLSWSEIVHLTFCLALRLIGFPVFIIFTQKSLYRDVK